jgi:membrane-bound serine protease (ClpP class)
MFVLLGLVLLLFLPSPWNLVGALVSLVLFLGEVMFWQRRTRGRRVQTGSENLVGAPGVVTRALDPAGQVRVLGELWEARSATPLSEGTPVRVSAVRGLVLEVAESEGEQ